jgi:hypothetical protein
MTDNDKLFHLYATFISATKGEKSFEACFDNAQNAFTYYLHRTERDSVLPDGVSSSKFDFLVEKFFRDNLTYGIGDYIPSKRLLQVLHHFHWLDEDVPSSSFIPRNWQKIVANFLKHYLAKENYRELYDYMHSQKFIDF